MLMHLPYGKSLRDFSVYLKDVVPSTASSTQGTRGSAPACPLFSSHGQQFYARHMVMTRLVSDVVFFTNRPGHSPYGCVLFIVTKPVLFSLPHPHSLQACLRLSLQVDPGEYCKMVRQIGGKSPPRPRQAHRHHLRPRPLDSKNPISVSLQSETAK
jgi:hypothetical protein